MNQRLLGGLFALAISLSVVGAAVTAQDRSDDDARIEATSTAVAGAVLSSAPAIDSPPLGGAAVAGGDVATAQVPLRSADPDTQASLWRPDDAVVPVAVRVEALGLEALVRSVGVDQNNDFAVPEAETVGWYKHGPAPGQQGSTVLAAHVDYAGERGAFFDLAALQAGDTFEVELSDGSILEYRVTENILYDKAALPAAELFRKDGDEVLRLITCGGLFDPNERSYRGNVVVTAVPLDA